MEDMFGFLICAFMDFMGFDWTNGLSRASELVT